MKKTEAIRIITTCAKDYHNSLENNNLMFIFGSEHKLNNFEVIFLPRNFKHLTGVVTVPNSLKNSSDFYNKCLSGQLSISDFEFAENGTTEMKLNILPHLMKIEKTAKMVGEYNYSKSLLITEKLVGSITACLGFKSENGIYIPNTAIMEDIRDISNRPQQRILAIFKKDAKETVYNHLCYVAKGIAIEKLNLPKNITVNRAKQPSKL